MKPLTITLTRESADALLWALKEHTGVRTPVRTYVDTRYAGMDEAFRNCKIGEVQDRLNRLLSLSNRIHLALIQEDAQQHNQGE
jgi:hypothetical protein